MSSRCAQGRYKPKAGDETPVATVGTRAGPMANAPAIPTSENTALEFLQLCQVPRRPALSIAEERHSYGGTKPNYLHSKKTTKSAMKHLQARGCRNEFLLSDCAPHVPGIQPCQE